MEEWIYYAKADSPDEVLRVSKKCFCDIVDFMAGDNQERGGILGSSCDIYEISHFVADTECRATDLTYIPNANYLNGKIKEWSARNICYLGLVHSHVNGCPILSEEDKKYISVMLSEFSASPFMWFPVVADSQIIPYRCSIRNGAVYCEKYRRVS